jgi:recombination protein RecT
MASTQAPEKPAQTNNAPAKQEQKPNAVVIVGKQVRAFIEKRTLVLPSDYSVDNALKSAWLTLQTVQDSKGGLALNVCDEASICNALLDMVVQGLNPAKKQCYFIVYGKTLVCQRSYFGDQALAERVKPGIEIYSGVVYEGDGFEYELIRGRTVVTCHKTSLENQKPEKIIAAYCGIVDTATGEDLGAEVMTIDQIRQSWSMSKTYKPGGNSPHTKFPDQMALRTVIRRRTKNLINSSNDAMLLDSIRRQDENEALAEMEEEVMLKANTEPLSLPESAQPETPKPEIEEPQPAAAETAEQPSLGGEPNF